MLRITILFELKNLPAEEVELSVVEDLTKIERTVNLFAFYLGDLTVLAPKEILEIEVEITHFLPEVRGLVSISLGVIGRLGGVSYHQKEELRFGPEGFYLSRFGGFELLTAHAAANFVYTKIRESLCARPLLDT